MHPALVHAPHRTSGAVLGAPAGAPSGLTSRSVVVIEDDPDIRELIVAILARRGMIVHTAATASAGIALVTRLSPDIVTVDVGLPDADGVATAAFLRDLTATRHIPILMLSASPLPGATARTDGSEEAYLGKPFRPRELRAKVAELLAVPERPAA